MSRLVLPATVALSVAVEADARADLGIEADATSSAGVAFTEGLTPGAFTRPDFELFLYGALDGSVQPVLGYSIGFEWWSAPGAFGFGLPAIAKLGMRFGPDAGLRGFSTMIRLGVGFSVFQVDSVKDPAARPPHAQPADAGGGIYIPTATADIAFGTRAFRLGAEVRAAYRWEWVIEDRPQVQLGLTLSFPLRIDSLGGPRPEDD